MAGILDRFNKVIRGTSDKIVDYTSTISPNGDLSRITQFNVIINSWKNILSTPLRTYPDDPTYGSDLIKFIFSPADTTTIEYIKHEVYESLSKYDDRANIQEIKVTFFSNKKGFRVSVFVEYEREEAEIIQEFDESLL